jgi:two-component system sensor histidine kinase YesM
VDEIGILYHEYDKMMRDIDTHIRESYQNRILSMDSQMKALEAQINSHFLYNTLESINSIAEIEEVESIVIMTKALGDMFRYSIKTESELVPIHDELQHISNYMAIQQIRYGDKIKCHLHIDESLKDQKILKLILQPLVENAIYHGLENKQSSGSITIKGYRSDNSLCFEVIDDGTGMTTQQIDEILALLAEPPSFTAIGKRDRQSIGIKNVHSRINLYYGNEYGLNIESEQNQGTLIKITVPYN